jgi:WD40 repeat protein
VGDFLVIATADNKVRLFTAADQKPVRELAGAKDWLLSADGHAAGGVVAGGTFDGQVLVWNLADGKLLRAFFAAPGYQPPTR